MGSPIDHTKLTKIPHPPEHLFGLLGNIPDVDPIFVAKTLWKFAEIYGPIFEINLGAQSIILGSQELINEACDQERFKKVPGPDIYELRALLGDGLFTAHLEEPNWGIAHRVLVPKFGPLGIIKMFDDMLDISAQMVQKWDRLGPDHSIDAGDDFTRLAFDTIGLCAFNHRFNQFYTEAPHPFAGQMIEVLLESGRRSYRLPFMNHLAFRAEAQRQWNVKQMHDLCDNLIRERQMNPRPELNDLLNAMLNGEDPKTGEKLSAENIRYQMATFLVAGHETTSSTLSFLWAHLVLNPAVMLKAQQQVDEVVGDGVLTPAMLPKLKYLDACIKETLRLSPTITEFEVVAIGDQVVGQNKKYLIKDKQSVTLLLSNLHKDPKVWGDDAELFRPERMLDGKFEALPPNSWKPFGNGIRACIGRGFAEQEMLISVALVLQRFQVTAADPNYVLKFKSTLTLKPDNFFMKVRRRPGKTMYTGMPGVVSPPKTKDQSNGAALNSADSKNGSQSLTIYYGGNMNTCASLSQTLSQELVGHGIRAEVKDLDAATEGFPTDRASIIITSTYEGQPPDNAKKLVAWLNQLSAQPAQQLKGVKFALFGVGNSDWVSTYHRIPRFVSETMEMLGAEVFMPAAYTNVKEDFLGPWEDWTGTLIQALTNGQNSSKSSQSLNVSIKTSDLAKSLGGEEMSNAIVVSNTEIADTSVGLAKRHIEIRLPEGSTYLAGDYLVVQGRNPSATIRRVLVRFGLNADDLIQVDGSQKSFLPREAISIEQFLSSSVELSNLITKRQIATFASLATDQKTKQRLGDLQSETHFKQLIEKRYSAIDFLEQHPGLDIPFSTYVDMLQPMSSRQYSISSSPLHTSSDPDKPATANIVSLTFDVHEGPALSGQGTFHGVASTHLAQAHPGESISCFVRPTNLGFRLPTDPMTPLILVAAGTGIAPMRAFLQERAAIKAAGVRELGPCVLFFGCRDEEKDFIYKHELIQWQREGIVQVMPCFSRGKDGTNRYVHEAISELRGLVGKLFGQGGKIFLCGSAAKLGRSTAGVFKRIYVEETGEDMEAAERWLESVRTDRYIADVY